MPTVTEMTPYLFERDSRFHFPKVLTDPQNIEIYCSFHVDSWKRVIRLASLGALLVREPAAGGYRIQHIYRSDPDRPDRASPLARPGVDIADGDVLLSINGRDVLSVTDPGELLRNQVDKQVLRIRVPAFVMEVFKGT